MKLLMENWRKYLTEEEALEEGPFAGAVAGLGLALGLGGPAQTTDAPAPEPTHQVDTQQAQPETGKVIDNKDGTFSYTASTKHQGNMNMTKSIGAHRARVGFARDGSDAGPTHETIEGSIITNFQVINGMGYVTVTTAGN